MNNIEKVLEVENLTISFKTDNGLVRAVRGVSFDLHKGETLCIVGESGSGKSVTSKAIMGILANNAIIDGGTIMYEGENLLEISEDEFHRIRGHKIGMIFQDPLSSLNPIVRIGKQITEATLINGNHLKKMFNEKINKELTLYKNTLTKFQIRKNKAKTDLELGLKEQNDILKNKEKSQEEKAEAKEKIAELKNTYKEKIAKINDKYTDLIEQYAKELKVAKAKAKVEVKEYAKKIKNEYLEEVKEIKKDYANDKTALKEKLADAKEAYTEKNKITKKQAKAQALEIMKEVGIPQPERRFRQYPFEFSGGMRQRIVIAIALTASPDILICDEPTTALDVTIQAQILELINKLKRERQLSCIFITHDLGVVANMADRVAVMYAGKIVEYGTAREIFFDPKHPYTWALLSSIPDVDSAEKLDAIPGTPPNMIYPPKGDAFALRSKYALNIDFREQPPFFKITDTHYAATWLLHPNAPKVEMPKIVSERIKTALKEERENA